MDIPPPFLGCCDGTSYSNSECMHSYSDLRIFLQWVLPRITRHVLINLHKILVKIYIFILDVSTACNISKSTRASVHAEQRLRRLFKAVTDSASGRLSQHAMTHSPAYYLVGADYWQTVGLWSPGLQ